MQMDESVCLITFAEHMAITEYYSVSSQWQCNQFWVFPDSDLGVSLSSLSLFPSVRLSSYDHPSPGDECWVADGHGHQDTRPSVVTEEVRQAFIH